LATVKLRDRDAIVTKEGLVFRVFGYDHPPDAYVCDLEYAPVGIFCSGNPKAARGHRRTTHCKFYEDESWTYLKVHHPQYLIPHAMLQKRVIGVRYCDIAEVRRPQKRLKELLAEPDKDELLTATQDVLELVMEHSGLRLEDFGVFGSMLHNFHHPKLSDIDLTIYGMEKTTKLRRALRELHAHVSSPLRNEFETDLAIRDKRWRFRNLSPEEYVWHQQRKMIYALFKDKRSGRTMKIEFEPVKDWKKVSSKYDSETRILPRGWVKMTGRVTKGSEAPFNPSVYRITPIDVIEGPEQAAKASRILSYVEEFRLQASRNEEIYVEGNVEEVRTPSCSFFQVVLTYCSRYYEQVLKCKNLPGHIPERNG